MGPEIMNLCLCLILQGESTFVELAGQTPRLMELALGYLKARVLVLSYCLSISMAFPKVIEHCTVAMYADDTDFYFRGASLAQLKETIKKDLEIFDHWLKGNMLSLNVVKTVSMNIVSCQKESIRRIRL